jgi:hypothetical protein
MRYELRTTFTMPSGDALNPGDIGRADRLLRQLYEVLPAKAMMGAGVAPVQWFGNRYVEEDVVLQVTTRYRTVFGLTADRYRIDDAVTDLLAVPDRMSGQPRDWVEPLKFEVWRVYGHAELEDPADPTKKLSHPC